MCVCLAGICAVISAFDLLHSGGGLQLRRVSKEKRVAFHLVCVIGICIIPSAMDYDANPLLLLGLVNAVLAVNVVGTMYCHIPGNDPNATRATVVTSVPDATTNKLIDGE